jgi:hypothetical protein
LLNFAPYSSKIIDLPNIFSAQRWIMVGLIMHWCNLINPLMTALDGSLDSEEDLTKEGNKMGEKFL